MENYTPVVQSRRQVKPVGEENDVYYRTATHKNQRDGERQIVMIRMGREVMKSLGWTVGDKVCISQSIKNPLHLAVEIDAHAGYTVHPAVISENSPYQDQIGKAVRAHFVGTIDDNTPIPRTSNTTLRVLDWEVKDGTLMIRLPRDSREIDQWLKGQESE